MRLKNKVSLVTGAGSGIGQGIAQVFAQEGSEVIVCDIDGVLAEKVSKNIRGQGNGAIAVEVDVSDSKQVQNMFDLVVRQYGHLDILCNNAGVFTVEKYFLITELPEQVWDRVISVNLTGAYLCCKYGIPLMLPKGGSIINISSTVGLLGSERAAYSASKGGLISFTRSLARQYAANNVRTNAICPGPVDTPGRRIATVQGRELQRPSAEPLLNRIGTPDDIAGAALYLASDESSWVTGVIMPIDGGATAY